MSSPVKKEMAELSYESKLSVLSAGKASGCMGKKCSHN